MGLSGGLASNGTSGGVSAAMVSVAPLAKLLWARRRAANYRADQPTTFDFYVDSVNGNDSNSGLNANTAFATISHANSLAVAGTRIGLRRGSVFREQVTPPQDNMLYGSYGELISAAPVLKGSKDYTSASWSVNNGAVYQATVTAPSEPTGMAFLNTLTPIYPAASLVAMTAGTFFFSGTTFYIWLPDSSNPTGKQIEVTDLTSFGINDRKAGTVIQDITVQHWFAQALLKQPPVGSAGGAYKRLTIGPSSGQGINWSQTDGGVIEDCVVQTCWNGVLYPSGQSQGIIAQTFTNLEVRHNLVTDCYKGISFQSTYQGGNVHHNIVLRASVNGLDIQGGTVGFPPQIFNNFVHHRPNSGNNSAAGAGHGIVMQVANVGPVWRNNIVVSDYTGPAANVELFCLSPAIGSLAGTDIDYNLGWLYPGATCQWGQYNGTLYSTFAAWKAALIATGFGGGNEAHGLSADPLVTSLSAGDVTLGRGSPAIAAGKALNYPTESFYGTAPDLGAYEVA